MPRNGITQSRDGVGDGCESYGVFGWPLRSSGSESPDAKAARNQSARGSVPTECIGDLGAAHL